MRISQRQCFLEFCLGLQPHSANHAPAMRTPRGESPIQPCNLCNGQTTWTNLLCRQSQCFCVTLGRSFVFSSMLVCSCLGSADMYKGSSSQQMKLTVHPMQAACSGGLTCPTPPSAVMKLQVMGSQAGLRWAQGAPHCSRLAALGIGGGMLLWKLLVFLSSPLLLLPLSLQEVTGARRCSQT